MAKNTDDFDFGNFDFNTAEFDDFGEGGFGDGSKRGQSGKRKAITEFTGGFFSGFKKGLFTKEKQRKFLKRALPKGYINVYDDIDTVASDLRNFTDQLKRGKEEALEPLREPIEEVAKDLNKRIPDNPRLKGIKKRLESAQNWGSQRYNDAKPLNEAEATLNDMRDTLAAIFEQNNTQGGGQQFVAKTILADGERQAKAAMINADINLDVARSSRTTAIGVNSLVHYQNNVQIKIERKRMELAFRHYSVARRHLDVAEQTRDLLKLALPDLIRNTGLPEAVKIHNLELAGQVMKQRFWGEVSNRFTNTTTGIIRAVLQNSAAKLTGTMNAASGQAQQALSMYGMLSDTMSSADDLGLSRSSMAGEQAGQIGSSLLFNWLLKKGGKRLDKLKNNERIKHFGRVGNNMRDWLPSALDRMYNEREGNSGGSMLNYFIRGILDYSDVNKDVIYREDRKIRGGGVNDLERQMFWNMQSQLALTEVIPGHLEHISHTLMKIQTGKDTAPHMRYNYSTGLFESVADRESKLNTVLRNKNLYSPAQIVADELLKTLDPNDKLSDKAKRELKRYIFNVSKRPDGKLDIRALASDDSPISDLDASMEIADVISETFDIEYIDDYKSKSLAASWKAETNASETYHKKRQDVDGLLKGVRFGIHDIKQSVINEAKLGNSDILHRLGIVSVRNNQLEINTDDIMRQLLGEGPTPPTPNAGPHPKPSGGTPPNSGPQPHPGGAPNRGWPFNWIRPHPTPAANSTAQPAFDLKQFDKPFDRVIAALKEHSTKTEAQAMVELLVQLNEKIATGIPTMNLSQDIINEILKNRQRNSSGVWKRMVSLGGKAKSGVGSIWKVYKKSFDVSTQIGKSIFKGFKRVGSLPFSLMSKFTTPAVASFDKLKAKAKVVSIYLKDQTTPILEEQKIRAGEYIDSVSGKVIKTLKDIKGDVLDKSGKVIVTLEQLKNEGYTLDRSGLRKVTASMFGAITGGVGKLMGLQMRVGGSVIGGITGFVGRQMSKIANGADPIDVYVLGETTPRLLKTVMANKGYWNTDKTPILSFEDIKGAVLDAAGNTVLTLEDVAKGLVDKSGKALKPRGFLQKAMRLAGFIGRVVSTTITVPLAIMRFATRIATRGFNIVRRGVGKLIRGTKKGLGYAKSSVSWIKGIFSGNQSPEETKAKVSGLSLQLQAQSTDYLAGIYEILDRKLNKRSILGDDGSGLRRGSRESYMRLLSQRTKPGEAEPKRKDGKSGLLAMISGLLGAVGAVAGYIKGGFANMMHWTKVGIEVLAKSSLINRMMSMWAAAGGWLAGKAPKLKAAGGSILKSLMKHKGKAGLITAALAATYLGTRKAQADVPEMLTVHTAANNNAYKEMMALDANTINASDVDGSQGAAIAKQQEARYEKNLWDMTKGSALGEVGAMGVSALAMTAYDRYKAYKNRNFVGPMPQPTGAKAGGLLERIANRGPLGKAAVSAANFAMHNKYGRVITAAASGAGIYAGMHALNPSNKEVDLTEATTTSGAFTLGLEAATLLGIPWLAGKVKSMRDAKRLAEEAAKLKAAGVNPQTVQATQLSRLAPNGSVKPSPIRGIITPGSVPAATAPSMLAGAKGVVGTALKSKLSMAYGLYSGLTTEGTWQDKAIAGAKAYGSSVALDVGIRGALTGGRMIASAAGRQAAMAALRAGGGVALSAAGQALAAAGPAIAGALPFLLGAAAVGAVGYIGYRVYKHYYQKDNQALLRFRMAQYGFDLDDEKHAKAILSLEQMVLPSASLNKSAKSASFSKDLDLTKALPLFGISLEDRLSTQQFIYWFVNRFKPVFLLHLNLAYTITGKRNLTTVDDDIKGQEAKITFLNAVNAVSARPHPHTVLFSPFVDRAKLKYDNEKLKEVYTETLRNLKKESTVKQLKDKAALAQSAVETDRRQAIERDTRRQEWFNNDMADRRAQQTALDNKALATGSAQDRAAAAQFKEQSANLQQRGPSGWFGEKARSMGGWFSGIGASISNTWSEVTGGSADQKKWQLAVYKAFCNVGFSDQQARILTAEIGRENSYNPKVMFGSHPDPHSGYNLGMLSWQGSRAPELIEFLKRYGVWNNGKITPGYRALEAQAAFIMYELKKPYYYKMVGAMFLSNPNPPVEHAFYMLGKRYIGWRIDDPKYKPAGIKNRTFYWNMINTQLKGQVKPAVTANSVPAGSPPPLLARPGTPNAAVSSMQSVMGGTPTPFTGGVPYALPQTPTMGAVVAGAIPGVTDGNRQKVGPQADNADWDLDAIVKTVVQRSQSHSLRKCALYVRIAMQAGDRKKQIKGGLGDAWQFAAKLPALGWQPIGDISTVKPQKGDIAVFPKNYAGGDQPYGHVCIYTGAQWVSDFRQQTVYPSNTMVGRGIPHKIFRATSQQCTFDQVPVGTAGTGTQVGQITGGGTGPQLTSAPALVYKGSSGMFDGVEATSTWTSATDQSGDSITYDKDGQPTQIKSDLGKPKVSGEPSGQPKTPKRLDWDKPIKVAGSMGSSDDVLQAVDRRATKGISPDGSKQSAEKTHAILAEQSKTLADSASKTTDMLDIAAKQLDVQTQMLKALNDISNIIGKGVPKAKPITPRGSVESTVPVSMKTV